MLLYSVICQPALKNIFFKKIEPRSSPVGPRSKPTVVGPHHRCLGGALTHAAVEPKEVVAVEPSGPDLGHAPWSRWRSAPKEVVPVAEGSLGACMPRRPSSRLLGEVGGRRARQSPSCVKLCLEGVLDGEGAADVAGLDVLAGPLIPAACEVC
jgi:hypothetical protein